MLQYTDTWWVKVVKRSPQGESEDFYWVACKADSALDACFAVEDYRFKPGYRIEEVKPADVERLN